MYVMHLPAYPPVCEVHQDVHTSSCFTTFYIEDRPLYVLIKVTGQASPGAEPLGSGVEGLGRKHIPGLPLGNWMPVSPSGGWWQ